MPSNKKIRRYKMNVLGQLERGIQSLRERGDFDILRIDLGLKFSDEELLAGSGLEKTELYRRAKSMGDVSATFVADVTSMIREAHETYKKEHYIEPVTLSTPFDCEGTTISTLYSTFSTRQLDLALEERLKTKTIVTSDSWFAELFGRIANNYGRFYGVLQSDAIRFGKTRKDEKSVILDINHYHVISKELFEKKKILSPNTINLKIYNQP